VIISCHIKTSQVNEDRGTVALGIEKLILSKGMRMSQKRRGRGSLDEGQPKPQRFVNYIHASV